MEIAFLLVALAVVVLAVTALADTMDFPAPLVLIAFGIGVSFVPGVRLTGRIKNLGMRRGRGRIRVERGRGVPGGVLAFRNGIVRGTRGGRPVRTRVLPAMAAQSSRALAARVAERSRSGLAGR